ncbi:flippase-like domain-containing protein [Flammeovirga yaeyamensis]|uniref:Flippase-like domain-containing protein n=1 Tax=Flammeovirga yaeyamensis TaxID=367791 RepID=A0AAX1NAL9_9BACT|nr:MULTISPECIES: lysylphosphatidylglycerol synthase transmembrane domain-containing protein [Flammeovirga]ANQ49038.1 flippase-like domain-containing protein [Flammeovirga sp. MY04]MBB3699119.1 hypothetical protein [Flammeovirga yaeyamensis]NMF36552.1 flippase-like domain-containing protein [Flammeovirga yaeyamensis]QWG03491.1 flippase-like domain-containing protein [Flammeovirga yaeyamensis]
MKLKEILKYIFSFFLAGALLWYVLKGQDLGDIKHTILNSHWQWLFVSASFALFSHYIRGLRWGLMLKPLNLKTSPSNLFMATMSGYAGNTVLPRFGEFFRCGILQKLSGIPAKTSFGAVLIERAVDMIVFIVLFGIAFLSQFDRLYEMVTPHIDAQGEAMERRFLLLGFLAFGLIVTCVLLYLVRERLMKTPLFRKIQTMFMGVYDGMRAVLKLERKEFYIYIAYTALIWVSYFFMSYVVFFVLDDTSHLSIGVGFVMMMMSGLGMVIPTPGGTGSVHFFATQTLIAYGIAEAEASSYALIMHTSQTILVLVVGGISTLIANHKEGHSQEEHINQEDALKK